MNLLDEKFIERSKTKLILIIIGSLLFILLGFWILSIDTSTMAINEIHRAKVRFLLMYPEFLYIVGIATVLLFSACVVLGIKKLFDKRPGLILNPEGMIDNSSGISAGFIPWEDIKGFEIFECRGQKFLVVKMKDPEKYIKHGNFLIKILNIYNYSLVGSSITISSTTLKIQLDELLEVCNSYLAKYGQKRG